MPLSIFEPARAGDRIAALSRDVRAGMSTRPRSVPPKYFYDERGSRLFDVICDLPEYYLARAESSLLDLHAAKLVDNARPVALIEIGSGLVRKTHRLIAPMCARVDRPSYVAFDIDRKAVLASAQSLGRSFPSLRLHGVVGDFGRDLGWIGRVPMGRGPRLFAFLGSTIGNLEDAAAVDLLRCLSDQMNGQDRLLLGTDLVKDPDILHAAYNDARGVTADFNRNVLRVLARELDGDLDENGFEHLAFYDPDREQVEMHLIATRSQRVVLRAIELGLDFDRGEHLVTEISRKFTRAGVELTLARAGLQMEEWVQDTGGLFALAVARRAEEPPSV